MNRWNILLLLPLMMNCKHESVPTPSTAQYTVTTIARLNHGYKDGPLGVAGAESIAGIVFDAFNNLYFADTYGNRIRKISPDGIVSTVAGTGESGFRDGGPGQAQFYGPVGLTIDNLGNLYVSQAYAVRKITPDGNTSTIIGLGTKGVSSIHLQGDTTNYPSIEGAMLLPLPQALALDNAGNLFVIESGNNSRIIKINPDRQVSVFYGTPFSLNDRTLTNTNQLLGPNGIAFDKQNNLLVSDSGLGIIKLSPNGKVIYFTGDGYEGHVDGIANKAEFSAPTGAVVDKLGNLYVGDGEYIRKIESNGNVSTIAGNGRSNNSSANSTLTDGPGNEAQIQDPKSMAFDANGNLFVVDNGGIRKITPGL